MTSMSRLVGACSVNRPRRIPVSVAMKKTNPTGHGSQPSILARCTCDALPTPVDTATWIFDGMLSEALPGVTVQVEFGGRLAQLIVAVPAEPFTGVSSSE
jgi:hypothetical protein